MFPRNLTFSPNWRTIYDFFLFPFIWLSGGILLFFSKAIFTTSGKFIGGIDVRYSQYWFKNYIGQRLAEGQLPLWNPHYYSGHPFIANPETTVFYPFTVIFVLFPTWFAFTLDVILHVFFAGWGMYLLLRLITGSKTSGIGAGIIYAFSGYMIDRIYAGHLMYIHTAAALPWVIWFLELGLQREKGRYFIGMGVFLSLLILGGNAQVCYYSALFAVTYFLLRLLFREKPLTKHWALLCGWFLIAIITAFGLSAIQIFPSIEFSQLSDRALPSIEFSTYFSYAFSTFTTFLVPQLIAADVSLNWEMTGYVGVLSLILVGVGWGCSRNKIYLWVFSIIALLSVSVMLGNHTPIFKLYYDTIPGFKMFRIPARAVFILVFCCAALAGIGIHALLESTKRQRKLIAYMLSWTCLAGGVVSINYWTAEALWSREIITTLFFLAIAFALSGLIVFPRLHLIFKGLLLTFLLADLFWHFQHNVPIDDVQQLTHVNLYEQKIRNDTGLFRVSIPYGETRGMVQGYYDLNGNTPLVIGKYFRFMHDIVNVHSPQFKRHTLETKVFDQPHPLLGTLLNTKYLVTRKGKWINFPSFQPRAFLVPDSRIEPNFEAQLQLLKHQKINPLRTVLLPQKLPFPTELANAPNLNRPTDHVKIVTYSPEKIILETNSNEARYLVLSELDYPGWRVQIDGVETTISPANYMFRALAIPPGNHTVTFLFRPSSLYKGASVSFVTLLAFILGALFLYVPAYLRKTNVIER